jgi:hypothetical protein
VAALHVLEGGEEEGQLDGGGGRARQMVEGQFPSCFSSPSPSRFTLTETGTSPWQPGRSTMLSTRRYGF